MIWAGVGAGADTIAHRHSRTLLGKRALEYGTPTPAEAGIGATKHTCEQRAAVRENGSRRTLLRLVRYFFSIVCLQSLIKKELLTTAPVWGPKRSIRKLRDPDYQYTPSTNVPGTHLNKSQTGTGTEVPGRRSILGDTRMSDTQLVRPTVCTFVHSGSEQ